VGHRDDRAEEVRRVVAVVVGRQPAGQLLSHARVCTGAEAESPRMDIGRQRSVGHERVRVGAEDVAIAIRRREHEGDVGASGKDLAAREHYVGQRHPARLRTRRMQPQGLVRTLHQPWSVAYL
jgi:hypothetical protein